VGPDLDPGDGPGPFLELLDRLANFFGFVTVPRVRGGLRRFYRGAAGPDRMGVVIDERATYACAVRVDQSRARSPLRPRARLGGMKD